MSLINDALKRAAAHQQESKNRQLLPQMQPVERAIQKKSRPFYIYLSTLLLVASIVLTFLWINDRFLKKEDAIGSNKRNNVVTAKKQEANLDLNKMADSTPEIISNVKNLPGQSQPPSPNFSTGMNEAGRTVTVQIAGMNMDTNVVNNIEKNTQLGPVKLINEQKDREIASASMSSTQEKEDIKIARSSIESANTITKQPPEISGDSRETIKTTISNSPGAVGIVQGTPPQFPELRLNGIFYRPAKPSAIINGKLVFPGDDIEGVKIISIERNSVTVEFGDQKKVLRM